MSAAVTSGDLISTFPMSKPVNLPFLYAHGTMIINHEGEGSITTYSIISRPTP
jgi:hypothetical protein